MKYIHPSENITECLGELYTTLKDAQIILNKEPNYQVLPSNKEIVFVGDIHGDVETTEKIINKYLKDYRIVFMGDYVDRAKVPFGSLRVMDLLLRAKLSNPKSVTLLRGDHEFKEIFHDYGFGDELMSISSPDIDYEEEFEKLFANMPYIVTTKNGVIALHGGLPNINSIDEVLNLPKGIMDYSQNNIISQIVWNDNVWEQDTFCNEKYDRVGYASNTRGPLDAILYLETYFTEKMNILNKKILVRGHMPRAKGHNLNNRIFTIHTSQLYAEHGILKGIYVAILNPQKEIKDTLDLRIEFL